MKNRTFHRYVTSKGRRRGQNHLFVLSAAFLTPALAARPASAAFPIAAQEPVVAGSPERSPVLRFEIAPSGLDAVLAEFERVTQIKVVLADTGLQTLQSAGVTGNFTPEQAMEQLLLGLSVRATFEAAQVTLDVRDVREFVEVQGEAPRPQSPKYSGGLRDTPQTLIVIPQQVFQEQNAMSLREVLRNTPGITMSIGEGASGYASGDAVLIRGFNARNDIYIDGARDPGEVSRDMFNTEAVEVAKGPTSVTGGRGSTGGSINLVTKTPGLDNTADVRLTGGSANYRRTTLDVNRRVNSLLAFRLNGMWQDAGYPGRDVQRNRSWGFAPSLTLGLASPTQLTLSYSRLQQDNIPDWGIPALLPDAAIAQGVTVKNLDFSNWYGIASRDYEKSKSDVATVILNHRINSSLSLRNLTRYGKNFRDAVITPPRPAGPTAGQGPEDPGYDPAVPQLRRTDTKYQYRDDRVATNQTDLTATFRTGRIGHRADLGLEFARDRQPTLAFAELFTNGRPPVDDLFHPTPYVPYTAALAPTGARSDAQAVSTAVYAFDTVSFGPRLQADLGVRWDRVDIDYDTVATTGAAATFGRTDHAVTGRSGLIYRAGREVTLYGAFSNSFAPSYDGSHGLTLAATGANGQALAPENSHNIEVGVKWDPAPMLQTAFAVFATEKTNAKTTDLSGATVLAGDQQVKGVELSVTGNITSRWGAFAGLSVMDGKVKDSGVVSEIGQRLAYVPHVSLNLWSTYRLPVNVTVGGGANYSDGNYFNQTGGFLFVSNRFDTRYVENAAVIQSLTKYWVFNAMAMYPLNRHLQLQVNVNNLGNTKYADRAYDRHFLPGPARQVLFAPVITF